MQKLNTQTGKGKTPIGCLLGAGIIASLCVIGLCVSAVNGVLNPTPQPQVNAPSINTIVYETAAAAAQTGLANSKAEQLTATCTWTPTVTLIPLSTSALQNVPALTSTATNFPVIPTLIPYPTATQFIYVPPPSGGGGSVGCCKHCTKGKPCGNSCIKASYTCHQPPGCACY